jgi:hypothetical protein
MTKEEYQKLKQKFKADYERKLEALEIVYLASRERGPIIFSWDDSEVQDLNTPLASASPTLASAIKDVLPSLTDIFNINDVIELVEARHPEIKRPINPTSVSGGLRQLHKRGILEVVEPGRGTRPTIYAVSRKNNHENE